MRRSDGGHPDELRIDLDPTPEASWDDVRKVALCVREERHGVFLDYNQNARDRTIASTYSVRPDPGALVSCPLHRDEVPDAEPGDLRLDTVPARLRETGDPSAPIDDHAGSLDSLLELAARDERGGLGDAPWPPHFPKQKGEGKRVAPSRARRV